MKIFKVEGWYRYNDDKDFEQLKIKVDKVENAIKVFKGIYKDIDFYKITVEEIL
tara:strand:+ start:94 stop:255 length:162 start_codon:yes stop_codon:yes gene_type:complete